MAEIRPAFAWLRRGKNPKAAGRFTIYDLRGGGNGVTAGGVSGHFSDGRQVVGE